MTLINGLIFYFYAKWKDRDIIKRILVSGKRSFFIGGTASYAAYGIVVWACLFLPIAVVSSIRETSILLGLFFFKREDQFNKIIFDCRFIFESWINST